MMNSKAPKPQQLWNAVLYRYDPLTKKSTKDKTLVYNQPYAIASAAITSPKGKCFYVKLEETEESKRRREQYK